MLGCKLTHVSKRDPRSCISHIYISHSLHQHPYYIATVSVPPNHVFTSHSLLPSYCNHYQTTRISMTAISGITKAMNIIIHCTNHPTFPPFHKWSLHPNYPRISLSSYIHHWHSKLFWENIKLYMYYQSFLNIFWGRQVATYSTCMYLAQITPGLLMTCWYEELGHQQPWYWTSSWDTCIPVTTLEGLSSFYYYIFHSFSFKISNINSLSIFLPILKLTEAETK